MFAHTRLLALCLFCSTRLISRKLCMLLFIVRYGTQMKWKVIADREMESRDIV